MKELSFCGIHAGIGEKRVLNDLNLTLKTGETHVVVGLSGRNLNIIKELVEGNLEMVSGRILLDGKRLSLSDVKSRTEVVDRVPNVFYDLTVTENIYLNSVGRVRFSKRRENSACEELLKKFGIHFQVNSSVRKMTEDEKMLLNVLRAYVGRKEWIICYDTMIDLGSHSQEVFINLLEKLKEKGYGILYLSSRIEDAMRIADRISVTRKGTILLERTIEEVLDQPDEFMSVITGWKEGDMQQVQGNMDVLKNFVAARRQMLSDRELQKELSVLARDMLKVIGGDRCLICLTDQKLERVINVYDNDISGKVHPWEKKVEQNDRVVCEIIEKGRFMAATRDTAIYGTLFTNHEGMNSMLCMPIKQKEYRGALLMVFYREMHQLKETDQFYMDTFAKEIAIAMETSELIGKSTLLQESHHRIKNNLQMIVSLVYMQKRLVLKGEAEIGETFDAIIRQVNSIAKIHDLLSGDSSSGSIMNLAEILAELVGFYERPDVAIFLESEDISIPYNKATSFAIAINEILTNCLKHAYGEKEEKEKKIWISAHNDGVNLTIRIADNGKGFPEKATSERHGIGTFLIDNIVRSSGGTVTQENQNGAVTTVVVPVSRVYEAKNSAI